MATKALTQRGELTSEFYRALDAVFLEVLKAYRAGELTEGERRVVQMHKLGAESVAGCLDALLPNSPKIDWTRV
jgi:hypothetical protein